MNALVWPTAAANNDFVQTINEALIIPQSATNGQTFTFAALIVGDTVPEEDEIFLIDFTTGNANDCFARSSRATVVVLNDDISGDNGECGQTVSYLLHQNCIGHS